MVIRRGLALAVLCTLALVNQCRAGCEDTCVRKEDDRFPELDCKYQSHGQMEFQGERYTIKGGKTCVAAKSRGNDVTSKERAVCCTSSSDYETYSQQKKAKG